MTTGNEWIGKVGSSWADEWRRTDRSFRDLTIRLLDAAGEERFGHALDIGCGAGEITLKLAESIPVGQVTGIDLSEDLVAVARERTAQLPNVRIEHCDAASWIAAPESRPGLLISRHGVMFFPEPIAAFAHLRQQASADARLVFSCFRERKANEWASALAGALPESGGWADPYAPGPFAFGDSGHTESILLASGWKDIVFEQVDYLMVAGQGDDAVEDALSYFLRIGPVARVIAERDTSERPVILARLREMLSGYRHGDTLALPASCWIVTARSSG